MHNEPTTPKSHVEPEWRQKARELRAAGLTHRVIAERLGRSIKTVANFFTADRGAFINYGVRGKISEVDLTEPHVARTIRPIIKKDAVMLAAQRFAKSEITRAELMLAIAA